VQRPRVRSKDVSDAVLHWAVVMVPARCFKRASLCNSTLSVLAPEGAVVVSTSPWLRVSCPAACRSPLSREDRLVANEGGDHFVDKSKSIIQDRVARWRRAQRTHQRATPAGGLATVICVYAFPDQAT
jgi:hypothetical protein